MGLLASVGRISFGLDQLFGPGWSRSMNLPPRLLLRSRRGSQYVLDDPIKGCKMIEFQLEIQGVQVMPHFPKMIGRPRQLREFARLRPALRKATRSLSSSGSRW